MASTTPPPPPPQEIPASTEAALTRDEFNRATRMFDECDRNHDGLVDAVEFHAVLEAMGRRAARHYSAADVERLFLAADANGDGVIDYDEWMAMQAREKRRRLGLPDEGGEACEQAAPAAAAAAREAAARVGSVLELHELLATLRHSSNPPLAQQAAMLLGHLPAAAAACGRRRGYTTLHNEDSSPSLVAASEAASPSPVKRKKHAAHRMDEGTLLDAAPSGISPSLLTAARAAMSSSTLEIAFNQVQYTALASVVLSDMAARLSLAGTPLPSLAKEWAAYLTWTETFNLDPAAVERLVAFVQLHEISQRLAATLEALPFSTVYFVLTALFPLVTSFVILVLYKPVLRVVWFFTLTLSLVVLLVGVATQLFISRDRLTLLNVTLSANTFSAFTAAGAALVLGCLLVQAAASWWHLKAELARATAKVSDAAASPRHARYGARKHPLALLRAAALCALCVLVGSARQADKAAWPAEAREAVDGPVGSALLTPPVEGLLLACAALLGAYVALCLCEWGRKRVEDVWALVDSLFVGAFLFVLPLLYAPVTKHLLMVFQCEEKRCVAGEWYPKYAHDLADSVVKAASLTAASNGECEACRFYEYGGEGNASLLAPRLVGQCVNFAAACPGEAVEVLQYDNTLQCMPMVRYFYWPASLLGLVGFTFGIPYLYYSLISRHTALLRNIHIDHKKLSAVAWSSPAARWRRVLCCTPRTGTSEADVAWDYRVSKSRNRARTIYLHFHWRFRYFRLALLLQRLALVLIATFVSQRTRVACVLMLLVNLPFLLVAVRFRPYFNPASHALNIAAALACVVNPILILLSTLPPPEPLPAAAAGLLLLFFNLVLPLVFLGVGMYYACKYAARQQQLVRQLEDALSTDELKRIVKKRKANDRELDKSSLSTIASVFMLMAFTSFLSIFLLLLARVHASAAGNVVQSSPAGLGQTYATVHGLPPCEVPTKLAEVEFLYMPSWEVFTSNCCCRDRNQTVNGEIVPYHTELWTCPDLSPLNSSGSGILHKQRRRQRRASDGSWTSGLSLRPFCSPFFAANVTSPYYDESLKAYVVSFSNGTLPDAYQFW